MKSLVLILITLGLVASFPLENGHRAKRHIINDEVITMLHIFSLSLNIATDFLIV